MILSIPFLAADPAQFDPDWASRGFGAEAVLFDRRDLLDDDVWSGVRALVHRIARTANLPSFTFHFPVNDCDYVADARVRDRLFETLDLVADNHLDGLVLHSNRVRDVRSWRDADLSSERRAWAEGTAALRERVADAPFWLGLENMPLMGNDATDLDPLLVFPEDYRGLVGGNVGITWDLCHYSYSVHVAELIRGGRLVNTGDHPEPRAATFLDFADLADHTVHYHFSAFRGIADPSGGRCMEGMAPWDGTLGEDIMEQMFARAVRTSRARAVTLEIREDDYRARTRVHAVAEWCRERIRKVAADDA